MTSTRPQHELLRAFGLAGADDAVAAGSREPEDEGGREGVHRGHQHSPAEREPR